MQVPAPVTSTNGTKIAATFPRNFLKIGCLDYAGKVLTVVLTYVFSGALRGAILCAGFYSVLHRQGAVANHIGQKITKKLRKDRFYIFIDAQGCLADFDALCKTFITNLSKSGVSPKMA